MTEPSRRNRNLRRPAGVFLILLGVVGLALCITGTIKCWLWRPALERKVLHTCDRAEKGLGEVGDGLERVRASLEQARSQLAAVPRDAAKESPSPLRLTALRFLAPRLTPQLQDSGRTLGAVADTAVVLGSLLEGFQGMPLGPSAPLNADQLREATRRVRKLGETAEKLLALVGDATDDRTDEIEAQTAAMEHGIARALGVIDPLREQIALVRGRVVEVRTHFARWLLTAATVATLLLTWAALGQLSLALHGWSLCKTPWPARPDGEASATA